MIGLHVGRPVGNNPVGGAVSLIEGVAGKGKQSVPKSRNRLLNVAILDHSRFEGGEQSVQFFGVLLSHCLSQVIGLSQGEVGCFLGGRHHLFLINNESIGRPEDILQGFFQTWVNRSVSLQAVFAFRVIGMRINTHWTGTIKRDSSGDILEGGWLHQSQ